MMPKLAALNLGDVLIIDSQTNLPNPIEHYQTETFAAIYR
jgi:hypothetical protein